VWFSSVEFPEFAKTCAVSSWLGHQMWLGRGLQDRSMETKFPCTPQDPLRAQDWAATGSHAQQKHRKRDCFDSRERCAQYRISYRSLALLFPDTPHCSVPQSGTNRDILHSRESLLRRRGRTQRNSICSACPPLTISNCYFPVLEVFHIFLQPQ
jgi:hypothetical protein